MEQVEKDPEEAPGRSVLPENRDAKTGVSTWRGEADPSEEGTEESKREEEQERPKGILNLQRELGAFETNIRTAADAKELKRRAELEEARRMRREQQESDVKSIQEKCDEIMTKWSALSEKVLPQDLREALNGHQQLCAATIADKKKLISDLQQELKRRDDQYVKTLRKNEEEIDLLIERMEDQIKALTKAYREELSRTEIARLTEREEEEEKYVVIPDNHIPEGTDLRSLELQKTNWQLVQQITVMKLLIQKTKQKLSAAKEAYNSNKHHIMSLQKEVSDLQKMHKRSKKEFEQKKLDLWKKNERSVQQHKRLQEQVKHFAAADSRRFKEVWLMCEAERKQQVEKVLALDSRICRHLGVAWKQPPVPVMQHPGPIQPGKLSVGMMKKVMELLCDEGGFLMESELLKLQSEEQTVKKLSALFHVSPCSYVVLTQHTPEAPSLGLEDEDLPTLADFLLKYKQEQRAQTEDVCAESSEMAKSAEASAAISTSSEVIHGSRVLPALRSFLEQQMKSSVKSRLMCWWCFLREARNTSDYKAYWDSMANIISKDKLKMWDAAERTLTRYHTVLTEISELDSKNMRLEERNKELKERVQQMSRSRVR
ncbi:dynein regulatory complex protein 1, partial [Stegastes partitus]|uniref:Dynein regulatory complex protein 1 n=1 Tax=Stegastes partitus TaxID=144197 RepID=A0A9Y4NHS4_9TELE